LLSTKTTLSQTGGVREPCLMPSYPCVGHRFRDRDPLGLIGERCVVWAVPTGGLTDDDASDIGVGGRRNCSPERCCWLSGRIDIEVPLWEGRQVLWCRHMLCYPAAGCQLIVRKCCPTRCDGWLRPTLRMEPLRSGVRGKCGSKRADCGVVRGGSNWPEEVLSKRCGSAKRRGWRRV
jgi:hypothetical protein